MRVPTKNFESVGNAQNYLGNAMEQASNLKVQNVQLKGFDLNQKRLKLAEKYNQQQTAMAIAKSALSFAQTVNETGQRIYDQVQAGRRAKAVNGGLDELNAINQEETANHGWTMVDDPKNPSKKIWKEDKSYEEAKKTVLDNLQKKYGLDDQSLAQVQQSLGQYIINSRTQQQNAALQDMQTQDINQRNDTINDLTNQYVAIHAADILDDNWTGSEALHEQFLNNPYIADKNGAWEQKKISLRSMARLQVATSIASSQGKTAAYDWVDKQGYDATTTQALKDAVTKAVATDNGNAETWGTNFATESKEMIASGKGYSWAQSRFSFNIEAQKLTPEQRKNAEAAYNAVQTNVADEAFNKNFADDQAAGLKAMESRLDDLNNGVYDDIFTGIGGERNQIVNMYQRAIDAELTRAKNALGLTDEQMVTKNRAEISSFDQNLHDIIDDYEHGNVTVLGAMDKIEALQKDTLGKLYQNASFYDDNKTHLIRAYNSFVETLVSDSRHIPAVFKKRILDTIDVANAALTPSSDAGLSSVDKANIEKTQQERVREATAFFADAIYDRDSDLTEDEINQLLDGYTAAMTFTDLTTKQHYDLLEKMGTGKAFGSSWFETAENDLKTAIALYQELDTNPAGLAIVYEDDLPATIHNRREKGQTAAPERKFLGGYEHDWTKMTDILRSRIADYLDVKPGEIVDILDKNTRRASPTFIVKGKDAYRLKGNDLVRQTDTGWEIVGDLTKGKNGDAENVPESYPMT